MPTVVFWVLLVLAVSTALGVLVGQHLRRVRVTQSRPVRPEPWDEFPTHRGYWLMGGSERAELPDMPRMRAPRALVDDEAPTREMPLPVKRRGGGRR